ncbi:MAG: T9SS type A sorting domain-containing protein [Bacteroidota bacterium]
MICCLFSMLPMMMQAQSVTVDLASNAPSTIDVNYTAQGSFPVNIWNNQVLTIVWPDVGAGGPGDAVSLAVSSSNSGWFFNLQGSVSCASGVCSQKVISSSNNVFVDLSTTTSVVTLSVSGTGSDNTTYSVSGATNDLFVNHAIFGNVGTVGMSVTLVPSLPVELLSFEAQATADDRVLLDWRTSSELNNDYFVVERSKDGQHFLPIDRVAGAGSSQVELQYKSWDHKPFSGTNYYRLQQVDFDGTIDYSDIRAVAFEAEKPVLSVFPNPTSDWLTISYEKSIGQGQVQLFSASGQLVQARQLPSDASQVQLPVNQLPEGIYWLSIQTDGQVYSEKVIITRN